MVPRSKEGATDNRSTLSINESQDQGSQAKKSHTNNRDPHTNNREPHACGLHAKMDFLIKNMNLMQLSLKNLETQVSNINDNITSAVQYADDSSRIIEVEDLSDINSRKSDDSTATDNADISNEDKASPLTELHDNITKRAVRNDNKRVTRDNEINIADIPNAIPKVTLEERLLTIAQEYPKICNRSKRYPTQRNDNQHKFAEAVLIKEADDLFHNKGYIIGHTEEHCHIVFEPIDLPMPQLRVDMIHNDYVSQESLFSEFLQQKRESNQI